MLIKSQKIKSYIGVILLFVLGFGILFYPNFSNWWNTRRANSLIVEYDTVIQEKNEEEINEIYKVAVAYNGTLIGNTLPDAFAELQLPPDATYEAVLNPVGNGYMGTCEIPQIDQNIPIYHYTTEEVLEKGIGHLAGSSLPVGGENSHCVISAHRGLPSAKLFTDLDRLKIGDTFYLHVLNRNLAYEVDQIKVVEPEQTEDLSIVRGEDYCTLLTCTPYAVNSHRLLVRGHRVPYTEEQYLEDLKTTTGPRGISVLIRVLCGLLGLILAILLMYLVQKFRGRKLNSPQQNEKRKEIRKE